MDIFELERVDSGREVSEANGRVEEGSLRQGEVEGLERGSGLHTEAQKVEILARVVEVGGFFD